MLYPRFKVNKLIRKEIIWDTQKNIEEEEKWALKKEELEKRIRKNKFFDGANQQGKIHKYMDIYCTIYCY